MPSWLIVIFTIVAALVAVFLLSEWMVRRSRAGAAPVRVGEESTPDPAPLPEQGQAIPG